MIDEQPIRLRPAQRDILKYQRGKMAVSAVPGSGKTFTLSLLAAQLIADGKLDVVHGQQVLIVTYMNSAVENFKRTVRQQLEAVGMTPAGYDVRTLHSLGLEIVRLAAGGGSRLSIGVGYEITVLDEAQSNLYLNRAIDTWRQNNPDHWYELQPDGDQRQLNRWRRTVEQTARAFIRAAKNERRVPATIAAAIAQAEPAGDAGNAVGLAFTAMFSGIYEVYQAILDRQGARDFDDLIWEAADLIANRPDMAEALSQRWPYVLEDEAQDSVPLQEVLLGALTAPAGNWVRVGDPNQAITSTFTAAHPRYFNAFIERPDVLTLPLPNSGRCAPKIFGAANRILHWVCDSHPVPEVREFTFRRQEIKPTPPGDSQPNPRDSEADIRIAVFANREDAELPAVAGRAVQYAAKQPQHTIAVLVPTNDLGHAVAVHLDRHGVKYDNLLRGGSRERHIAASIHALLAVLADPLSTRALVDAHQALFDLGHPAAAVAVAEEEAGPFLGRFHAILRSVRRPEAILFPADSQDVAQALPAGVASAEEILLLDQFAAFLQKAFKLRELPIDDMALALGDELFARGGGDELDLALAYQIASVLRRWRDAEPDWRLPELVAQLADVAQGRRNLPLVDPDLLGFEPTPGQITLITQHKAKGLEWDAVFLIGVDGRWLPGSLDSYFQGTLEFIGGNPEAEVIAQLRYLLGSDDATFSGRTPTESANVEVISERLRLFYVAITRARRYLHISRSRATRRFNRDYQSEPATVMSVLYQYLKQVER